MARLTRLAIAGHPHVMMQRGNNGAAIVADDDDRRSLLQTLRDAAAAAQVAVHAYVLLDDELRLLATPAAADGLSRMMQALGRRHVAAYNRRHARTGTLWDGRFRGTVIESERWFISAMRWVETLPARSGAVTAPQAWRWSSLAHHLGAARDPIVSDHAAYWRLGNTPFEREAAYRSLIEQGVSGAEAAALDDAVHKGWALGTPAFLAALAESTARPLARRPRGRPRKMVSQD